VNDVLCESCRRRTATRGLKGRLLCAWCFVRSRPVAGRAILTAIVVGTVLTAINQSTALFDNGLSPSLGIRIALTYAVPYLVATWGALGASRI
jgi:hypothetical protein